MEVPFVGRNDFLSQLKIQYPVNKIIIVHGLKSIGKTRTVSEFVNRVRENVTNLEEIQIRLTDGNIQRAIFLRLATLLRVVIYNSSEWGENITQIIDAFNNKNSVEYIIHIDNCEHIFDGPISIRTSFKIFCCQLIKETHNVHIIIASSVFTHDFGEDAFLSELQPLSMSESSELLRSFMTDREKDVAKVAELCLGLPLALIMVGTYISRLHNYLYLYE
jgi:AAA+ ATPase superfamily predicted ATPase